MPHLTLDQAMEHALRHAQAGRLNLAEEIYRQLISHAPDHAEAWNNLGIVLRETGRIEESVDAFRRAATLRPEQIETIGNLGNALREIGRLDEALTCHQRVVAVQPYSSTPFNNLANTFKSLGRYDSAIVNFRRAVSLSPDDPVLHHELGMTLLLTGNFDEGWAEHEWRCRVSNPPICRNFPQPRWNGDDIAGRTILLHAEQGFGDAIQFVRYVPMVKSRGAKVILLCPPELLRLFEQIGADQLLSFDQPLPPFDLHCPLMNLPKVLGIEAMKTPYLRANQKKTADWRFRLPTWDQKKVGIAWAGRKQHANDRNRSIPPQMLKPIFDLPNANFISLQKDEPKLTPPTLDFSDDLHDFDDTAALVENLNLIITIDSAVAHLAGAMGKPTWVLLPFVPDWRWMTTGEETSWYPTMRLFRQPSPGDWKTPIDRVANEFGKQ